MAFTTHAICLILIGGGIVTSLVTAEGCFRDRSIFEENTRYMQIDLKNWINYSPGFSDTSKMTTESEERFTYYFNTTYTCLEEYEGNRMMVEVKYEGKDKIHYQCLQFTKLTKYVIRQAKTEPMNTKKEVDCENQPYDTEDDAVLVAMDDIQPEECPLHGGYQMLIDTKNNLCSGSTYKNYPNMRFHCGNNGVIAYINENCLPSDLTKYDKMRNGFVSHLTCIGSWSERREGIKTVLLRMRDMPNDLWCLHYKQKDGDEFLSMFMSFDGRCPENPFDRNSYKEETSFFGNLAKYVPHEDHKCSDSDYLDRCKTQDIGNRCVFLMSVQEVAIDVTIKFPSKTVALTKALEEIGKPLPTVTTT